MRVFSARFLSSPRPYAHVLAVRQTLRCAIKRSQQAGCNERCLTHKKDTMAPHAEQLRPNRPKFAPRRSHVLEVAMNVVRSRDLSRARDVLLESGLSDEGALTGESVSTFTSYIRPWSTFDPTFIKHTHAVHGISKEKLATEGIETAQRHLHSTG